MSGNTGRLYKHSLTTCHLFVSIFISQQTCVLHDVCLLIGYSNREKPGRIKYGKSMVGFYMTSLTSVQDGMDQCENLRRGREIRTVEVPEPGLGVWQWKEEEQVRRRLQQGMEWKLQAMGGGVQAKGTQEVRSDGAPGWGGCVMRVCVL